jgi:MftR C-terminal domain/IstB-like ATP binding protein
LPTSAAKKTSCSPTSGCCSSRYGTNSSREQLRLRRRARSAGAEQLIAEAVAKDLNAAPDEIRPTLIAASVTAAATAMIDRLIHHSEILSLKGDSYTRARSGRHRVVSGVGGRVPGLL